MGKKWKLMILLLFFPITAFGAIPHNEHDTKQILGIAYVTNGVNFRSSSEIEDNIIDVLSTNTEIDYYTDYTVSEWTMCGYEGKIGWICSEYLSEEKVKLEYLGRYKVTGYRMFSAAENGGRSDGVTASGVVGTPGKTVAMKGVAFGTRIYIEGLGEYVVEDRGVGSGVIDVACWTDEECYDITGWYDAYIVRD